MMLSLDLQQLVNKNKALFRDCKIDKLNEEAVVERFLNYAEIDDIKQMISLIGYNKVRDIFKQQVTKERINYISPAIVNLFTLYFKLQDEFGSSFRNILERTKRSVFFIGLFKKYYVLVGGTAIGLQLGHRKSIDFDMFAPDKEIPNRKKIYDASKTISWEKLCRFILSYQKILNKKNCDLYKRFPWRRI